MPKELNPKTKRVIELLDKGLSVPIIAERVGLKRARVWEIKATYRPTPKAGENSE